MCPKPGVGCVVCPEGCTFAYRGARCGHFLARNDDGLSFTFFVTAAAMFVAV